MRTGVLRGLDEVVFAMREERSELRLRVLDDLANSSLVKGVSGSDLLVAERSEVAQDKHLALLRSQLCEHAQASISCQHLCSRSLTSLDVDLLHQLNQPAPLPMFVRFLLCCVKTEDAGGGDFPQDILVLLRAQLQLSHELAVRRSTAQSRLQKMLLPVVGLDARSDHTRHRVDVAQLFDDFAAHAQPAVGLKPNILCWLELFYCADYAETACAEDVIDAYEAGEVLGESLRKPPRYRQVLFHELVAEFHAARGAVL